MDAPEISVIVPSCDRPALVSRAVASVLRQSFADFELLLVDANRATPPLAENPALTGALADSRVRVVRAGSSANAAASRNAGLRTARGKWITFLDDDDEYRPEKLAAQHALALQRDASVVVCGYEFVWPRRRRVRQTQTGEFRGDAILLRAFLGTPALFHRRNSSVFFDPRLSAGEDMLYAVELLRHFGVQTLPNVARPLVLVHPQPRGTSVHANKEAVWRAYRAAARAARPMFSRRARKAWLALGRVERGMGGHGSLARFAGEIVTLLRVRGLREWRLAAFALLTRLRR